MLGTLERCTFYPAQMVERHRQPSAGAELLLDFGQPLVAIAQFAYVVEDIAQERDGRNPICQES